MAGRALALALLATVAAAAPPADLGNFQGAFRCHAATHLAEPRRLDELADVVRAYRAVGTAAKGHSWAMMQCPREPAAPPTTIVLPSFDREASLRDDDERRSVVISTLKLRTPGTVVAAGGVEYAFAASLEDAAPRAVLDVARQRVSVDAGVSLRTLLAFLAYGGRVPVSAIAPPPSTAQRQRAPASAKQNRVPPPPPPPQPPTGASGNSDTPLPEVPVARQMASTVGSFFILAAQGLGVGSNEAQGALATVSDVDEDVTANDDERAIIHALSQRQQEAVLRRLDLSPDDPFLVSNNSIFDADDDADTGVADALAAAHTLGSYPWFIDQSVGGAVATDTHGSSLVHGSLSKQLSAVTLMLANGTLLTLLAPGEQTLLGSRSSSVLGVPHLVESARGDLFHAATVSMGALGVIVRLTFQTVPLAAHLTHRRLEQASSDALVTRVRAITRDVALQSQNYAQGGSLAARRERAYRDAAAVLRGVGTDGLAQELEGVLVAWFAPERRVWWSRNAAGATSPQQPVNAPPSPSSPPDDGPMPERLPLARLATAQWQRPRPPYGNTFLLGRGEVDGSSGGAFGPGFWSAFFRESLRPLLTSSDAQADPEALAMARTASRAVAFASAELAIYAQYELAVPLPFAGDCLAAVNAALEADVRSPRRRRHGGAPGGWHTESAASAFRSPLLIRFLGGNEAPLAHARGLPAMLVNLEDWVSATAARYDLERWRDASGSNASARNVLEWAASSAGDAWEWSPGFAEVLRVLREAPCFGTYHLGKTRPTTGAWRRREGADAVPPPASLTEGPLDEEHGSARACAFAAAARELDPFAAFRSGDAAQRTLALRHACM